MYNSYVDFDQPFSYPLQWLYESEWARYAYQRYLWRATLAQQGKPCRNVYQEELSSNLEKADPERQKAYRQHCQNVPEGRSFALRKAADNIAAQMAGGVDTYEYQINDPFMMVDADTEDLLAAKCEQDYIENHLNNLAPVFSNDIFWRGMCAVLVKYNPKHDKNTVKRINPKNIWFDTKYSSTGEERFRGYSTMISWKKLKKMIEDDDNEKVNLDIKAPDKEIVKVEGEGKEKKEWIEKNAKYSNRKIRSLNGLDIYVDTLNKLAASPSLAAGIVEYREYDHDLKHCYNLNWYRSFATDPEKRTNSNYNGDDVELTVIYDLNKKIEFKIINRRYVISMNKRAFKRKIWFTWTDPRTGLERGRMEKFHLDCPLKFQMEMANGMDIAPHPWSVVFSLLDTHDELCGWRARREHVSKILSILRLETNAADASSLKGVMNIMGIVLDDIQGDINSLNFQYAYDPIDSEIAHLENAIQQVLHAYDQFDGLQAMGDRASAAESGMAMYAVAQGLSVHQNALMELYADIARQCLANRVAYSPRREFPVLNHGDYRSITLQQMALNAIVSVKPKLAKKIQEKTLAANAMALLGTMSKSGLLNQEGVAYLMEQAMMGQMPRKLAETFVREQGPSEQEMALAQQQAQNDAMALQQNQQAYEADPMSYEAENVMQTQEPEVIDQTIDMLNAGNSGQGFVEDTEVMPLDMMSQEGAMTTAGIEGLTPESGGMFANVNERGEV